MSWKWNSCPEMWGCALVCKTAFCNTASASRPFVLSYWHYYGKTINGLREDHSVLLLNDTVNVAARCSGLTAHLTLTSLFPPSSRQPQPLESRPRYCPGAGREWQSTRGSRRRGNHPVRELEAGTGESENQCFTSGGEWWKRCTHPGWILRIEWLFSSVWVDPSELREWEVTAGNCLTIAHSKWVSLPRSMTALNRSSFHFCSLVFDSFQLRGF